MILQTRSLDEKALSELHHLRADHPHLPLIVVAPNSSPDVQRQVIEAGASDSLSPDELNEPWLPRLLHHTIEKARVQHRLQETESRYRSLFLNNHAIMLLVAPDSGEIVDANPAASRFYGYSRDRLRQMNLADISLDDAEMIQANITRALAGKRQHFRFRHRLASGEVRCVEVYSGPIQVERQTLLYSLIHDVTEHEKTETALRRESAINAAMAELARALISHTDLSEISTLVLEHAQQLTRSEYGFVGYIDAEDKTLVIPAFTPEVWANCRLPDRGLVFQEYKGLWGWVLNHRQPVVVNDLAQDPRTTGLPEGHVAIHRFLSAPALVNEHLVGQIAVANAPQAYSEEDLDVIERLASLYALAVQRQRNESIAHQHAMEQSTLYTISSAVTSLQKPERLLNHILNVVLEVLHADAGWIGIVRPKTETLHALEVIASRGLEETGLPKMVDTVVKTCPFYQQLSEAHRTFVHPGVCSEILENNMDGRFAQHVCVPLNAGESMLGLMTLLWHSPRSRCLGDDFLITLGQQIGAMLHNAQLYEAARQVDRLQLLNDLDAELATTLEPRRVVSILLHHLLSATNAGGGSVLLCKLRPMRCAYYTLSTPQEEVKAEERFEKPREVHQLAKKILKEGKRAPMLMDEIPKPWLSAEDRRALLAREDPQSLLAPIWAKERLMGLLVLGPKPHQSPFNEGDRALIQASVNRAAHALQNAQLYQASRAQSMQLAALNKISAVAVSSLNPQQVLQEIIKRICEALDSAEGSILLTDKQTGGLRFAVTLEQAAEHLQDKVLQPGEGIAGWVAQEKKGVLVNNVAADPRFYAAFDEARDFQTRSLICAPLLHHDEVVGVIEIVNKHSGPFKQQDLELLESAASIAATALENARLYKKAQQRAEELARINEIGLTLTSSLDISTVAEAGLDQIRQLFEADSLSLLKADEQSGELHFVHTLYQGQRRHIPVSIPPGQGITGWVLETGEAVIIEDAPTHPRFWSPITEYFTSPPRAMMVVPLISQTHVTGVLVVSNLKPNVYHQEDLRMLQTLIPTLVVALENARLYEDLKRLLREREETQVRLVHTEKMAALGRLVASLAHEINNPLQAVQGCITLAHEELLDKTYDRRSISYYIDVAEEEIDRISVIIRRMRDFYRPTRQEYRRTDIHEVLDSVLALTNKQLQHSHVEVERRWAEDLPEIHANPDHLKQVFLNLMLNAVDAMPMGGTLSVATDMATLPGEKPEEERPAVRITFTDTGMGMDEETISRLFEPFFTTKPDGSGLGLSISYSLVKAHQGEIDVHSVINAGTTMAVRLPIEH
ncbi:MAG: GAF domain-containing protein [Anaerolineae bacterium]